MQFRRTLPGAGSTDFYLTDPENGGLSIEQQEYAADLIIAYRRKYPDLFHKPCKSQKYVLRDRPGTDQ